MKAFRKILLSLVPVALIALSGTAAHAAQVNVTWAANPEGDLAGYRVHYGTAPGAYTQMVDTGNVTLYGVTGLTEGTTYYFALTAYDSNGNESPFSVEVSATISRTDTNPPVLVIPPNVSAEATGPLTPVDLGTASATDPEEGAVPATPDNTGPFARGTHTVTWTATDSVGNVATGTQTVEITDTTAPGTPQGLVVSGL